MARARNAPLHLVRRRYEEAGEGIFDNSAAAGFPQRADWGGPVKAFADRGRADAACAALNAGLLAARNPFGFQGESLADLTTFPPGPFRDWLRDAGLTPPPANKNGLADWGRWWQKHHAVMTAEQHHFLSTGLNKIHLYDVVALEPPATPSPPVRKARGVARVGVYTVELCRWKDDSDYLPGLDGDWLASLGCCTSAAGGLRLATFRDRGRATAYRNELQRRVPPECRAFNRGAFVVDEHPIEVEG